MISLTIKNDRLNLEVTVKEEHGDRSVINEKLCMIDLFNRAQCAINATERLS